MADNKEKETVDFGIQEMEDYIAERVEKKAITSGTNFGIECFKYFLNSNNGITLDYEIEKNITKVLDNDGDVEKIFVNICEKYNIEITDYSELSETFDLACKIIINLGNIGSGLKDLYDSWKRYSEIDSPQNRSKVMQEVFKLTSTLVSASGCPFSNIISEQFSLGAFLLKKGTELTVEYNKRFDALEEIWKELEAEDSELTDEEMQRRVDDGIKNANMGYKYYANVQLYNAIMKEYSWIFGMADKETRDKLDKQYAQISKMADEAEKFMDMYNQILPYATVEDYLGNKENRIKLEDNFNGAEEKKDPPPKDPIVLDLNNDGKFSTSLEDGVHFDYDGDGFAEKTAWISEGDGLLVIDKNNNGQIDNGSELFGDRTVMSDGRTAKDGFEALADLDTNGDGVIDVNDSTFDKLKVWTDTNRNGKAEEGELHSLNELGIESISLKAANTFINENGNRISGVSFVKKSDGGDFRLGELNFSIDYKNTVVTDMTDIPEEIMEMPEIIASGNVRTLRQAMALDSELCELVKAVANTNIAVEREELINKIILKWTGCENIEKRSRGGNIDACRLGAVEKFYGRKFSGVNGANPNQTAAATLNAIYDEVCNNVMSMLMAQTCLEEMISQTKVVYSPVLGKKYINYGEVIEMFDGEMEKNPTDGIIKFGYYVNYINFRYHTYI